MAEAHAEYLDRILTIELGRCTEAAAVAASTMIGRGDKEAADQAAVTALRAAFNKLDIDGTIVIGEGERDEAPMLYIGEKVGKGGPKIDIALDPLEGTTLTAKAMSNALAVVAMATGGGFLHSPDVYMQKIACGPGYSDGVLDLDAPADENVRRLAKEKGVKPEAITVCVLDRDRHEGIINAIRSVGARVFLIPDGDVAGIFHTTDPEETGIDLYVGTGGAPEGVLAAAALRCVGGQMQGRLIFRNDDERARAEKAGITDLDRRYDLHDLASGDVMFAATGVTDGTMLKGVKWRGERVYTQTVVMRSKSGTVRTIDAESRAASFNLSYRG
ncbi:class II fructose-bisphosphatase [Parvularcula dongshanensis]|uniref:Fructose-1,6-bisphosphatase n=1 Tax=Parvularcula dongshanensis TaxID=1173995 RepID=A0A840I508_9PROT|nr:class II fructose-bisphosphatase [Parvularcula dongshanensis]MBB4659258.1 fructose-1,6-bisphosphatase II / sedoheptulose-1,7-bisphosphatase [Parvularcula dongshanensis]